MSSTFQQSQISHIFESTAYHLTVSFINGQKQGNFAIKNEIMKSIVFGDWSSLQTRFPDAKLPAKTKIINEFKDTETEKYVLWFTKNKVYLGIGREFDPKFEVDQKADAIEKRRQRIFSTKSDGSYNYYEIDYTEECIVALTRLAYHVISTLILDSIKMADQKFTDELLGLKINGIEIFTFLGMKYLVAEMLSITHSPNFRVDSLKKPADEAEKKVKEQYDNYFKTFKLFGTLSLYGFDLSIAKWYVPKQSLVAYKNLFQMGVHGIYGTDSEGLIVNIKTIANTPSSMRSKDLLTYNHKPPKRDANFEKEKILFDTTI